MSFPKILFLAALSLFAVIGGVAVYKKIVLKKSAATVQKLEIRPSPSHTGHRSAVPTSPSSLSLEPSAVFDFPNIDRMFQLFTTGPTKLPIVETITYTSSVPWLKGRPAWIADYANYYATSRHFIARGLNGRQDYFTQKISPGSQFNVFRKDKRVQFYLLVDLSRCKMGLYYLDLDTKERVLLKTYRVAVGKSDAPSSSSQTPLGTYSLGSKIAIYKPGTVGFYRDQKVEMISVFGTRWIPFHEKVEGEGSSAVKGYGIHGAPWVLDAKTGQFVENQEMLGKSESDGSILLAAEDMEEVFAIIITKPSFVMIVKDFREAKLPGIEVATPTR